MLFNSYEFLLVFLPLAIAVYVIADRYAAARMPVLIGLSLVFYSYWNIFFLPVMVVSILCNWVAAEAYAATKKRAIILLAIVLNLAALGVYKYADFFIDDLAYVLSRPVPHLNLALPLGISFFTFHHIMYLVDLQRGRTGTYSLERYALYICFFPQAISGPIARWNEVMHQFGQRAFTPGWERRCAVGAGFIIIGLLQKLILADPLAKALDPIYAKANAGVVDPSEAWMAMGFAFQVFFDFASYSDIAIGLALIFGIELPRNFDAPFRKSSITEFWQCWHMTLTRFLRDYVFIPLSTLRIGGQRNRSGQLPVALILTMSLCGLWHGAGWHFILWGTLQGVALVVAGTWRRYLPSPPALIGWALTFSFFVATAPCFRATSLDAAWHLYQGLATFPTDFRPQGRNTLLLAAFCAVAFPASHEIVRGLTERPRLLVAAVMAAAVCVILVLLGDRENYQFVYFQF